MIFKFSYRVAWVDTDALGIMHFSNYFRLCERTEQEFMNSFGFKDGDIFLPRVDAKCSFKHPLKFNEIADVRMKIKEIGNSHLTFSFEIFNSSQNVVSALCEIIVVPVDRNMKKVRLNEEYIKKLKEIMDE